MNKTRLLINASAAILLAASSACDNISPDDRYIEFESITPQRTILLEDFTGQFCVNCSEGHEAIDQLKKQYGDKVVAVSIHARQAFSVGEDEIPGMIGLRTDEGDAMADAVGVKNELPSGVVDRTTTPSLPKFWPKDVADRIATPSSIVMEGNATLSGDKATATLKMLATSNFSGQLQLMVVEDNITAIQIMPNGDYNLEYTHNNVFRGTVNGVKGETVTLVPDRYNETSHTFDLKPHWNKANLSVVFVVYSSKGVENVLCVPITPEPSES